MKRKTIYEIADSTTELGVTLPVNAIVQNIDTKEVFSLNEKALSTDTLDSLNKSMLGGDNVKPQLITFRTPHELTGTNAMNFNLNQNWIVYLSGATTTITMTPITSSPVFTCNIEVVQDATGGRDLVLVDVDGKAIVNTQEFDFTTGGANERCFITIKYWVTGYRYLVDKYI